MRKKGLESKECPIGDFSRGFADVVLVVLIGAGMGVTPMISVLNLGN